MPFTYLQTQFKREGKWLQGRPRDKPAPQNLLFWGTNFEETLWGRFGQLTPVKLSPLKCLVILNRTWFPSYFRFLRHFPIFLTSWNGITCRHCIITGLQLSCQWFTPLTVEQSQSRARCYGLAKKFRVKLVDFVTRNSREVPQQREALFETHSTTFIVSYLFLLSLLNYF